MITKYLQKGLILNEQVILLQRFLMDRGYGTFKLTGTFGPTTEAAVKKYQAYNNIEQTGTVGPITRQAINRDLQNQKSSELYFEALSFIGKDASPKDLADDEVGCADSVSALLLEAFGKDVGIQYTISTASMYLQLKNSPGWARLQGPQRGAVIISPTGYGNGILANGHVGICGEKDLIMSNNSATGTWLQNYTTETWRNRYAIKGGFPIYYFKKI